MGKWVKIAFAFVAAVAFLTFVAIAPFDREPRYNGRSLSQWLAISHSATVTSVQREESAAAIRHIGAKGVPLLLNWVANVPGPKQKIRAFITQHPTPLIPRFIRRWAYQPRDYIRPNQARLGFMILGAQAAPAIPSLASLATNATSAEVRSTALNVLGEIGPLALPALLSIAQTPGAPGRASAIYQIGKLGTNALPAVPIVINLLDDPESRVPQTAATALGQLTLDPTNSLRGLVKSLQHPDREVRTAALFSLGRFHPETLTAIPELETAAGKETDPEVKAFLNSLLRRRDQRASVPAPSP